MRNFWPRFVSQRAGVVAGIYVLVLILGMLAAGLLPGPDPQAITSVVMLPPSTSHVLGTDELGRDVLLSIVHGYPRLSHRGLCRGARRDRDRRSRWRECGILRRPA